MGNLIVRNHEFQNLSDKTMILCFHKETENLYSLSQFLKNNQGYNTIIRMNAHSAINFRREGHMYVSILYKEPVEHGTHFTCANHRLTSNERIVINTKYTLTHPINQIDDQIDDQKYPPPYTKE